MYKESENMLKSNNIIQVKKLSLNKRESELQKMNSKIYRKKEITYTQI